MDGGAWWAAVHGVAKNRTRLSDFTSTFRFLALEKEMAAHSGVLAWRIPGTGKPGGLPSMGSHRVGHDWSDLAAVGGASNKEPNCQFRRHKRHGFNPWVRKIPWRRSWQPTPVFLPGQSQWQRSLAVTVHRVAKSWRQVKQLSMHECEFHLELFMRRSIKFFAIFFLLMHLIIKLKVTDRNMAPQKYLVQVDNYIPNNLQSITHLFLPKYVIFPQFPYFY